MNTWKEKSFDESEVHVAYCFQELDREIDSLAQDIGGLYALVSERTNRIRVLREQVADIARTLP